MLLTLLNGIVRNKRGEVRNTLIVVYKLKVCKMFGVQYNNNDNVCPLIGNFRKNITLFRLYKWVHHW